MYKIAFFSSTYKVQNNMKGIGYRVWEIANTLADTFDVEIVIPNKIDKKLLTVKNPRLNFIERDTIKDWNKYFDTVDTVIFEPNENQNIVYQAYLKKKFIITDSLISPIEGMLIEKVFNNTKRVQLYRKLLNDYKLQLFLSDYVITGSREEFLIMIGTLAMLGRINFDTYIKDSDLSNLIGIVPIGFSSKYNETKLFSNSEQFKDVKYDYIWNGGIWNHYSPENLIKGIEKISRQQKSTNLLFMYYAVNTPTITARNCYQLAKKLELLNHNIIFNTDPVYFDNRYHLINNAKVIVCMYPNSIEALTTYRLRFRDVLLYTKPIITTEFGLLGDYVKKENIGVVMKNNKIEDVVKAIKKINTNYKEIKNNIESVKHNYEYEKTCDCIIQRLKERHFTKDKYSSSYSKKLALLRT